MTRTVSILTLALALAGPTLAQQTEAPDRTQEFLGAQTAVDESLLGSHHYALVLQGAQNIGHLDYTITAADGGYVLEGKMGMEIGPNSNKGTMRVKLDAAFAVLESGEDLRESERGKAVIKHKLATRAGDTWTVEVSHQDEPAAENEPVTLDLEHTHAGAIHDQMASMLLIVRRLDLTQPGRYVFESMRWPEPGSETKEPAPTPLTAEVKEAGSVQLAGEEHAATPIHVRKGNENTMVFHVDAEGQLIAFGPVGAPIMFVRVDSEDAATQDMGETEVAEAAGVGTPKEAVMIYFKVLAQQEPYDRLDDILDWAAIKAEMGEDNVGVAAMSTKAIADLMKAEFKKRPLPMTPAQLEELGAELTVSEDGDAATVGMPGKDDPFTLTRRASGGWVIDHFPH